MNTWQLAKKEVVRSLQHTELSIGATASLWEAYLTPGCRRSINNARRYSSKPGWH